MKKILGKKVKDMNAITLVALVITIVVLIILAAVAINLSLGNNGIFNRAKTAKEQYQNAQEQEEIQTSQYSNYIDTFSVNAARENSAIYEKMINPTSWEVSKEQEFGNNLYGMRWTGKITCGTEEYDYSLKPIPNIKVLVNCGGYWERDNNGSITPAQCYIESNYSSFMPVSSTDLRFRSKSIVSRSNCSFDIWAIYTK